MPDTSNLNFDTLTKLFLIVAVVVVAHVSVLLIRRVSERVMIQLMHRPRNKARTINSLVTSVIVFSLYFGAVGWALSELGVSLTAYLASASIIGLAVGFGSQGIVQDVVTGLTIVLSDQFDVGDMVQFGDQAGVVQRIGMRFTVLKNAMGAFVTIPNRSIGNVIHYPRGYVRLQVDVTLPADAAVQTRVEDLVKTMTTSVVDQFAGVFRAPPEIMGRYKTASGKTYVRVKFRIWPNRGAAIETAFKQELVQSIKTFEPSYAEWMVAANYEVEKSRAQT